MTETKIWRILDANLNRATEGLRVVEETCRFVLDDAYLTQVCKSIRHDLVTIAKQFDGNQRLAARDTAGDVGTSSSAPAELHRENVVDILVANLKRVQQALRCLEEYAKVGGSIVSPHLKRLRYRTYELEQSIVNRLGSQDRLAECRLYVILDAQRQWDDWTRLAKTIVRAKADVIQLRDKQSDDQSLIKRAHYLSSITRDTATLFIVNDRPDVATISGASGVHLGQNDLPVRDARAVLGPGAIVGVSTHSIDQVNEAVRSGADYIGVGPTFRSTTKDFDRFPGLELLRQVQAATRLPAFAIGGITLDRLPDVIQTGISRVAVCGAIEQSRDPASTIAEFQLLLQSHAHESPS